MSPFPSNGRMENTASSIVACLFFAMDVFTRRCLSIATSIHSIIPAFSRHIAICLERKLQCLIISPGAEE
jgi:hypothetical protein